MSQKENKYRQLEKKKRKRLFSERKKKQNKKTYFCKEKNKIKAKQWVNSGQICQKLNRTSKDQIEIIIFPFFKEISLVLFCEPLALHLSAC